MAGWARARPVIVPGRHVDEPYASLLAGTTTLAEYIAQAPARVDPVYDDRPFFFATQRPWGLPGSMRTALAVILVPILALCGLLLVFGKPRGERARPYAGSVAYFAAIGLGFIAVELALLQHLTLLLGHPIFTLSVLLFTLLASGGVGSALGSRFRPDGVCLAVGALTLLYAAALPRVVSALLPLPLVARIAIAASLVAPLGFFMGMPFPRGLRATGRGPLPAPPFYWGLNGVFSVVGSIATMVTSLLFGFTWAMMAGALCYVVAAFASRVLAEARV